MTTTIKYSYNEKILAPPFNHKWNNVICEKYACSLLLGRFNTSISVLRSQIVYYTPVWLWSRQDQVEYLAKHTFLIAYNKTRFLNRFLS